MKYAVIAGGVLGFATLALLAVSCSILPAPQPDATHYFLLTAVAPAGSNQGTGVADSVSRLVIGLGPINFPDYLARADMVTRVDGNRVEVSAGDRWAEPLDITFKRILSQDLTNALDGAQAAAFPWFGTSLQFDYRVEPIIDRFEGDAQGVARLAARWTVKDGTGERVLYSSTTNLSVTAPANDHAAIAAALSQVESEFAGEIAAAIRQLHAQAASSRR